MPGVVSVQDHVGGLLDQVLKGVAIARDIYGIKGEHDRNKIAQQQADQSAQKFEDEQAGVLPNSDRLKAFEYGSPVEAGTPGSIKTTFRTGQGQTEDVYILPKSKSPLLTKVETVDDHGSPIVKFVEAKPGDTFASAKPAREPKEPKTREIKTIDPETGGEVIQIVEDKPGQSFKSPPPKDKGITKDQFAVAGFAKRMQQAEDIFGSLENEGFDRTSTGAGIASMSPINALKPDQLVAQEQAERNFVNSVLRRESGAAISKEEFSNAEKQYFPRAGDTADVLAQKKQNRDQAIASFKAEAGRAMAEIPDVKLNRGGAKDTAGKAFAGDKRELPNASMHPEAAPIYKAAQAALADPKTDAETRRKAAEVIKRIDATSDRPDVPMQTQGSP